MPEFSRPKKRQSSHSIDGMITKRSKNIGAPEYYNSGKLSREPRRSMAARQQNLNAEKLEVAKPDEVARPRLGDFSRPEQDPFNDKIDVPEKPKKMSRREKRKAKKDNKEPGRIRRWWKNRSRRTKAIIIVGVILLALGGLLGWRIYSLLNSVFAGGTGTAALNDEVRPEDLNTEGDGRFNVLLLGRGGDENAAPNLTDTIIIASVDIKTQKASLLSIPRDFWVESGGGAMKINAVYETARESALYNGKKESEAQNEGIKATTAAVRNIAGVPIHKYVLTDYKAFRDIVNALGGVDVKVPTDIYDGFAGWSFKAGMQSFNGDRALQYARTRHGSARGDFDRNENQRQLLLAMRQKATTTGVIANPVKLNSLANAVQKNIKTDLSIDEARKVFEKTKDLSDNNIKSLDLAKPDKPLVQTGSAGGLSVVMPVKGLVDYSDIRAYTRSNMRDPYLMQETPSVTVYNGTGRVGVAQFVGDVLSAYGYKVLIVETAKENQPKTVVVKASDKKAPFTERFLFKRFDVIYTRDLPKNVIPPVKEGASEKPKGDFVIVLGADFNKTADSGPTW